MWLTAPPLLYEGSSTLKLKTSVGYWYIPIYDINNMQISAVTNDSIKFWAQFSSILQTDLVVIFQMKSKPVYNSQEIDPHCMLWYCELASYCSSGLEKTTAQYCMGG